MDYFVSLKNFLRIFAIIFSSHVCNLLSETEREREREREKEREKRTVVFVL